MASFWLKEAVPLAEFTYLVFTRKPGESYRRRLRSLLLCLYDVCGALINSLVCWYFWLNRITVCCLQENVLTLYYLLCEKHQEILVMLHYWSHKCETVCVLWTCQSPGPMGMLTFDYKCSYLGPNHSSGIFTTVSACLLLSVLVGSLFVTRMLDLFQSSLVAQGISCP